MRYATMICIYVGSSCAIYSISVVEHSKGPVYTLPISVAMQFVIDVGSRFFSLPARLMIWVCSAADFSLLKKHYGETFR